MDEFCDLTLQQIVDTLGDDLGMMKLETGDLPIKDEEA